MLDNLNFVSHGRVNILYLPNYQVLIGYFHPVSLYLLYSSQSMALLGFFLQMACQVI